MSDDYCGSCREASFDGISFRVIADAEVTIQNIRVKRENVNTYTGSYEKVTPQQCYISNLKLAVTEAEYDKLKAINADLSKRIKGSVTTANGSQYKGEGSFAEIGERNMMDGSCTVRFDARTDFDVFAAA